MRIAMIDDEAYFRTHITNLINTHFPSAIIDCYECVSAYKDSGKQYHLLLLDLELPDMDGVAFAKTLKKENTRIIYVTSHTERTYDAFAINVIGFVNKEYLETELIKKINEYREDNHLIVFKGKDKKLEFLESEVVDITIFQGVVTIFTMNQAYSLDITFKALSEVLSDVFFLANRSEYINLKHIDKVDRKTHMVVLSNHKIVEISRRNWNAFKIAYNRKVNE